MRLYTKGGDGGTTALFGGTRVSKHSLRVAACGEVDETNAAIGTVIAKCDDEQTVASLRQIQTDLFIVGAELATPEGGKADPEIGEAHVIQLEQWIDEAQDEAPALRNFVLPGGTATAAGLHLARTVCRRAERGVVALTQQESVGKWVLIYLNRLGDLLFALARQANSRAGVPDTPWIAPRG